MRARTGHGHVLVIAGVVALAANLRPAAATVGPVLTDIRDDLGLSGTAAGVLLTLPVLCFGIVGPLAPALGRRFGYPRTVVIALAMLVAGLAIRLAPGVAPLFVGAALAGAAIAIGNVALPVLVRQNFPDRVGLMTGVYMTALVGVASISAAVAVPLTSALNDDWRAGLAIWAVPAVLALALWIPQTGRRAGAHTAAQPASLRPLLRDPIAWQVTLFFGLQSCAFYILLSWLPTIFEDEGIGSTEAGALLGVVLAVGIPLALTIPSYAGRRSDQRGLVLGCTLLMAGSYVGLIAAPASLALLWAVLAGIGVGVAFPLAQIMVQLRSPSVKETAGLSTMAQSIGYVIAAAGPLAVGVLRDVADSWKPALTLLIVLAGAQLIAGLGAGRDRHVQTESVSSEPLRMKT